MFYIYVAISNRSLSSSIHSRYCSLGVIRDRCLTKHHRSSKFSSNIPFIIYSHRCCSYHCFASPMLPFNNLASKTQFISKFQSKGCWRFALGSILARVCVESDVTAKGVVHSSYYQMYILISGRQVSQFLLRIR